MKVWATLTLMNYLTDLLTNKIKFMKMTYPQDFNQKYAYLLVYEGEIYTRAHDVPTRSRYDDNGDWIEVPQHTPAELFDYLRSCYRAQLGQYNLTHYLSERGFDHPAISTFIQSHGHTFNPSELSADFHRVRRYEDAYLQSRDRNAAKAYPATIPPPAKAARAQFVKLADLKAQPENNALLNHKEEHTLINGLIETLHDCTSITHKLNDLGDLEISYTRKDGNTGEAYIQRYDLDHYTPLFINTLNKLLCNNYSATL